MNRSCLPCALSCCLLLVPAAHSQTSRAVTAPPRQQSLDVIYTGRTLGYFRYPDHQSMQLDRCINDPSTMSASTRSFYKELTDEKTHAQFLVGMGDNFAMDLSARTFFDEAGGHSVRQPKDLYTWDYLTTPNKWIPDAMVANIPGLEKSLADGNGYVPADNVGCFIRFAGYDAIVPGKHDFYYGPERLRMLARFLAMTQSDPAFPQVRMLGANMAIVSDAPNAAPRIPDFERQRNILGKNILGYQVVQQPVDGEPAIQVDLPDVVLPWLRQITIHNAFDLFFNAGDRVVLQEEPDKTTYVTRPSGAGGPGVVTLMEPATSVQVKVVYKFDDVKFCPAAKFNDHDVDPYKLDMAACVHLEVDTKALAAAKALNNDLYYRIKSETPVLTPDSDWGVCLHLVAPQRKGVPDTLCQLFTVHEPFFEYPKNQAVQPLPYVVRGSGAGRVAIFGVIDPALQSSIGRLNYAWFNTNGKYDTSLEIGDPAQALAQALQECKEHTDCREARKILLAQMSNSAALQLISNIDFTFDLVISATDDARETGSITLNKTIGIAPNPPAPPRATDGRPPSVVTPGSVYNGAGPGRITLLLQHATVLRPAGCTGIGLCGGQWTLKNEVVEPVCACTPPPAGATTLKFAARTALAAKGVHNTDLWSTGQIMSELALLVMQETLHADVSMLQGRDLFEAKETGAAGVTPDNLKELVDRIYWKNDFALPLSVTGATLKSLLKKSDAFNAAENNSVNTDLEKGQGLITLGMFKEFTTKGYLVNSQPIRDAALYSVAATDYLAFGDTGYSDLQTPAVPPPYRPKDFRTLHPIANLVCESIKEALVSKGPTAAKVIGDFSKTDCGPPAYDGLTYQDNSDQLPFDTTAGYTAWRRFIEWAVPSLHYRRGFDVYAGANDAERRSQEKPRLSITMEKADLSFTDNLHQRTLRPVPGGIVDYQPAKFAGNPISQVTAPNSVALSYDNRTRFRRAGRRFDWYALDEFSYSAVSTQNTPTNPNYTRALASNTLGLEAGFLARVAPRHRQAWDIRALVSERLDTQLRSPLLMLPLGDLQGSTYLRGLNHSYRRLTRNGVRFDDERSWFEAGIEYGDNYRLPAAYRFGNQLCPGGAGENPANAEYFSPKPAVPPTPVFPAGDQSLLDCVAYNSSIAVSATPTITNSSPLTVVKADRTEHGVFVNFSFNVPTPFSNKVSFLLENRGDLFANRRNDLSTDTRFFEELSGSLLIAAFGNLSVKPEVDFYLYESRVTGDQIHIWQSMISLNYSFDWHSGLSARSLLYPSPPPKTSTPAGGR